MSICEAFDEATKDTETLENAAENFQELLQVETLEEMNQKIDEMAVEGKLDPALVLTAAKAYMSVKESPMVEEEVKDVMAHLYFKMKETMGRQQPKEVRILKHLLAVGDDPGISGTVWKSDTPGPELTTEDEDCSVLRGSMRCSCHHRRGAQGVRAAAAAGPSRGRPRSSCSP